MLSLDEQTAPYLLRRTVAASFYLKTDESDDNDRSFELVEAFREQVQRVFESHGYAVQPDEWGPFWGSAFITIFGRGEREELGGTFREHLADMTRDLNQWVKSLPPGIRLTVIIGSAVIGTAGMVATGTFPPTAMLLIALAPNTNSILSEVEAALRGTNAEPQKG
jgi:hypothetical protein